MNNASAYIRQYIFEQVFAGGNHPSPNALHLALYLSSPTKADIGIEVSGGSYARVPITFTVVSAELLQNTSIVTFPDATADWGRVTYWGVRTALTGGELVTFGEIEIPRTIESGDETFFPAAAIDIEWEA